MKDICPVCGKKIKLENSGKEGDWFECKCGAKIWVPKNEQERDSN